jgi:hypothetical protein
MSMGLIHSFGLTPHPGGDFSLASTDAAGVPHLAWSFDRTDIDTFIKAHVYLLDAKKIAAWSPVHQPGFARGSGTSMSVEFATARPAPL